MWTEKPSSYLDDLGVEGYDDTEFMVLHCEESVQLSQEALNELLSRGDDVCLVVDGDLFVEGLLSTGDGCALVVSGNVTCTALYIGEAPLVADIIEAYKTIEVPAMPDEYLLFTDISTLKAKILLTMDESEMESVASKIECEYVIDTSQGLDDTVGFDRVCEMNFDAVLAALEAGETIDDTWVAARG